MSIPNQTDAVRHTSPAEGPGRRLFVLLIVLGLLVAGYGDVLVGVRTMFFRDFGFFGYPLAYYHREAFWSGELPLWNPLSCCGLPFLAQWNTLVLYPGSLVYLLLPLPWSLNVYCFGHLVLGAVGMYELGRRRSGSRLGGGVAGLGYGLGGIMTTSLMWPNNVAALGWMPWVVMGVEQGRERGGRLAWAGGVVGAVQMLAGAPEIILFTWIVVGLEWIVDEVGRGWMGRGGRLARVTGMTGMVGGMALGQLLPFMELLKRSHRGEAFVREAWAMPWDGWANFFVPLYGTYPDKSGLRFQIGQEWTTSYYVGVIVVALAVVAMLAMRQRRVWLLGLLSAASVVLALGEKAMLLPIVERVVPVLQVMRFPIKYVVLCAFCLPLLAAYGASLVGRPDSIKGSRRRCFLTVFCGLTVLIGGISVVAYLLPAREADRAVPSWSGFSRCLLLWAGGVLLWLRMRQEGRSRGRGRLISLALLAVVCADASSHTPRQNPSGEPWILAPMLGAVGDMKPLPRLGESRFMTLNEATFRVFFQRTRDAQQTFVIIRLSALGNGNLIDAVPSSQGFFSLYLREANHLRYLSVAVTDPIVSPLLDLLGVSQITRPGTDTEWQHRPTYLPFVTGGQRPEFREERALLSRLADPHFDPRAEILLCPEAKAELGEQAGTHADVQFVAVTSQRVEADVCFEEPGMLLVSQSWYPCWHAWVGSTPAKVFRVNHALQGVAVPAGRHRVRLVYEDRSFLGGMAVSLMLAAGALWRLPIGAWRGRRARQARPA